ncbi:TPA: hypothetical protein GF146_24155 [Escherichia coli]|nr:hypothetical protein [Escherichia coli]
MPLPSTAHSRYLTQAHQVSPDCGYALLSTGACGTGQSTQQKGRQFPVCRSYQAEGRSFHESE